MILPRDIFITSPLYFTLHSDGRNVGNDENKDHGDNVANDSIQGRVIETIERSKKGNKNKEGHHCLTIKD